MIQQAESEGLDLIRLHGWAGPLRFRCPHVVRYHFLPSHNSYYQNRYFQGDAILSKCLPSEQVSDSNGKEIYSLWGQILPLRVDPLEKVNGMREGKQQVIKVVSLVKMVKKTFKGIQYSVAL